MCYYKIWEKKYHYHILCGENLTFETAALNNIIFFKNAYSDILIHVFNTSESISLAVVQYVIADESRVTDIIKKKKTWNIFWSEKN